MAQSENEETNNINESINFDSDNKLLNCRMYENEYPNVDDLVVVQVKSIADMGAYCSLLEYNNIEGMILMSELSRRRIRSVNRVIRVGRIEIVSVLHVNKEKGYIDLSKKRVLPDEVQKVEERWNKSKAVHSIMRHVAKETHYPVEELYRRFGWPLAKAFNHAHDGCKWALQNKEEFKKQFDIPPDLVDVFFKNIENRLRPQVVTIRAAIECTCFTKEGIEAIKKALKAGLTEQQQQEQSQQQPELSEQSEQSQQQHSDDTSIKIKLVAPPLFTVSLSTLNPQQGINSVNRVVEIIQNNIKLSGGNLIIKHSARVIAEEV